MSEYTLKEGETLDIGGAKITILEIHEDVVVGIDAPGIDIKRGAFRPEQHKLCTPHVIKTDSKTHLNKCIESPDE